MAVNQADLDPDEEARLNPPPRKYRVSFRTKAVFFLCFLLGLAAYFYMVVDRRISQQRFIKQNRMAAVRLVQTELPDFLVTELANHRELALKDEVKSWTLLNLWATWCPPCREEMPSLELLHRKFGDRLKIIALSVDDNAEVINKFISENKPTFTILWDKNQQAQKIFGVDKYPETFLISPDKKLAIQFSGPRDWASEEALEFFNDELK